jgi:hypothetical protein
VEARSGAVERPDDAVHLRPSGQPMTEYPLDDQSHEAQSTAAEIERAREELARQLEEACGSTIGATTGETTGQLRRLDDALLAAARAAEGMIALKQKARAERGATLAPIADAPPNATHVERIREFVDRNGCQWRAWAVIPGQASTTSTRNLGDLQNGWLAFESLSGSGKRRLIDFPPDWMMLDDSALEELLDVAAEAPARKRSSGHDSPSPD